MAYTTIDDPTKFFSTNLWVGDDTSPRTLTGFGHQPDFVWARYRDSGSLNHVLTDSVRGGDKMVFSNSNAAEDTKSHGEITSFNSDGITVADGTNATYPRLYFNDDDPFGGGTAGNYVGWSWKGGGTAVSNGDGSITSTVSADTTAGFSIVTYTGNGTNNDSATIGHGLGVTLDAIIVKGTSHTANWIYGTSALGYNSRLQLNNNVAKADGTYAFGVSGVTPSSTTFTVSASSGDDHTNASSNTYVAYCFAEKKGYSKFGSYTGNGNADGAFVYTGFEPAWVMVKVTNDADNWHIIDNKRNPFNTMDSHLFANLTIAEATTSSYNFDMLSNGFKARSTNNAFNASGKPYIYMAFAEKPFVTEGTKAAGTAR